MITQMIKTEFKLKGLHFVDGELLNSENAPVDDIEGQLYEAFGESPLLFDLTASCSSKRTISE